MKYDFPVTLTQAPARRNKASGSGTGGAFTDHMFRMDWEETRGWHDGRIVPYGPLSLDPAAACLQSGQALCEGLKAYRTADGRIRLFRPYMNAARLHRACGRFHAPEMDEDLFVSAIASLVSVDRDWIPEGEGAFLYARPFLFATEPLLGARPAGRWQFAVILSPGLPSPEEGFQPARVRVEEDFVRAVPGGIGEIKSPAGRAAQILPYADGSQGFDQVLWLDGIERRYAEAVGESNVFFVIGEEICTPDLTGAVLPGITRDTILALCKRKGYLVRERKISVDELVQAGRASELREMFAVGTEAAVSPVGELVFRGESIQIGDGSIGPVAREMYETIRGIQTGRIEDFMGWTYPVQ